LEFVGKVFNDEPEHIAEIGVNVGVILGFTEIVKFVAVAHCPAVGVNVYVVVVELLIAGDQIPVILLLEVVGRAFKVSPKQMAETGVNAGVILGFTEIVKFVVVAHCPAVGVNV
jgi:phosphate starvation-inducible membrane PsiE